MLNLKSLSLGVLAVLAIGGWISSSASAGVCKPGVRTWAYCEENNNELAGEGVKGSTTTAIIASHVGGLEVKIECPKAIFSIFVLEKNGKSEGFLDLEECKLTKPATCKLSAADEAEIRLDFEAQLLNGKENLLTGEKAGEELALVEVVEKAGCAIIGNYPLTGKQTAVLPRGELLLASQEMEAKKAGSKLKFGVEVASFSAASTNLRLIALAGTKWHTQRIE